MSTETNSPEESSIPMWLVIGAVFSLLVIMTKGKP